MLAIPPREKGTGSVRGQQEGFVERGLGKERSRVLESGGVR